MVLFDTTSLMFTGQGGESFGENGISKDHRPDLPQVVVGVVLDQAGRPIRSEYSPGNVTDVKSLLPVVARLRSRFGIRRMCVVADRGMISAETIDALEAQGIDYILGARERSTNEVREIVLAPRKPVVPLTIKRANGREIDLEIEEVIRNDFGPGTRPRRYIVCYNPAQARRDAAVRAEIAGHLFCSFLALVLRKEVDERLAAAGVAAWCHTALNFPDSYVESRSS